MKKVASAAATAASEETLAIIQRTMAGRNASRKASVGHMGPTRSSRKKYNTFCIAAWWLSICSWKVIKRGAIKGTFSSKYLHLSTLKLLSVLCVPFLGGTDAIWRRCRFFHSFHISQCLWTPIYVKDFKKSFFRSWWKTHFAVNILWTSRVPLCGPHPMQHSNEIAKALEEPQRKW
jgi:hypothetical protein